METSRSLFSLTVFYSSRLAETQKSKPFQFVILIGATYDELYVCAIILQYYVFNTSIYSTILHAWFYPHCKASSFYNAQLVGKTAWRQKYSLRFSGLISSQKSSSFSIALDCTTCHRVCISNDLRSNVYFFLLWVALNATTLASYNSRVTEELDLADIRLGHTTLS